MKYNFLEVLKTFKFAAILVHHSLQSSLGLDWIVTQIKEHVTSGLTSRLFYLWKLNLVVHTKYWKGAFCMDYEAKFTELKQGR